MRREGKRGRGKEIRGEGVRKDIKRGRGRERDKKERGSEERRK